MAMAWTNGETNPKKDCRHRDELLSRALTKERGERAVQTAVTVATSSPVTLSGGRATQTDHYRLTRRGVGARRVTGQVTPRVTSGRRGQLMRSTATRRSHRARLFVRNLGIRDHHAAEPCNKPARPPIPASSAERTCRRQASFAPSRCYVTDRASTSVLPHSTCVTGRTPVHPSPSLVGAATRGPRSSECVGGKNKQSPVHRLHSRRRRPVKVVLLNRARAVAGSLQRQL